jgi:hypothetical protein
LIYSRSHVQALEGQIAYLKEQLGEAKKENRDLLDRLLAKHNVQPITEPAQPSTRPPDILAPFGVNDAEIQDAFKESWIREETQYIVNSLGCDEGTARTYAEQEYVARHQIISES